MRDKLEGFEDGAVIISDALCDLWQRLENRMSHLPPLKGISTGMKELDALTGGLKPGQLAVIAGRPRMGKSAVLRYMLRHVAVNQGKGVVLYCLEDRVEIVCHKIIREQAEVDLWRYLQEELLEVEYSALIVACDKLMDANIFLDDAPELTIAEIARRVRKLKAEKNIDLCFVDPVHLLRTNPLKADEANMDDMATILKALRSLAQELHLAIVVTSSIKEAEPRTDNRPRLCDLYNAGDMEAMADTIILIHRPEYYNPDDLPGTAELIIVKQPDFPNAVALVPYNQKQFLFGEFQHITDIWDAEDD